MGGDAITSEAAFGLIRTGTWLRACRVEHAVLFEYVSCVSRIETPLTKKVHLAVVQYAVVGIVAVDDFRRECVCGNHVSNRRCHYPVCLSVCD